MANWSRNSDYVIFGLMVSCLIWLYWVNSADSGSDKQPVFIAFLLVLLTIPAAFLVLSSCYHRSKKLWIRIISWLVAAAYLSMFAWIIVNRSQ